MKSYIPVTFFFLALGFYQASGGREFIPEQRQVAVADAPVEAEIVARASTEPTLAALTDLPVIAPLATVEAALIEPPAAVPADTVSETSELIAPAKIDLRAVDADVVNMREGPSTDFGVVDKLTRGTEVEVVEIGESNWVRLRVVSSGLEGWMAARFLVDVNT